ncbi:MAG: hypothetical protein FH756_02470 [Firmicutes bacterium]|nr:hypothetical protein [Bacillota bacterium]
MLIMAMLTTACFKEKQPNPSRNRLSDMNIVFSEESFLDCVKAENIDAISLFLRAGIKTNAQDEHGVNALMWAVKGYYSSYNNYLSRRGKKPDPDTAYNLARQEGYPYTIYELLEYSAEVNVQDKQTGLTPLMTTAYIGDANIVRELLQNGAEVNEKCNENGMTPLMLGTDRGNIDIVKELLDASAKVSPRDNQGRTALWIAVRNRLTGIVNELLKEGADPNVSDDERGMTPLILAASYGDLYIVRELLDNGANVNARDAHGNTALMRAIGMGSPNQRDIQLIKLLLNYGARVELKNNDGNKALDKALKWSSSEEIVKLLNTQ